MTPRHDDRSESPRATSCIARAAGPFQIHQSPISVALTPEPSHDAKPPMRANARVLLRLVVSTSAPQRAGSYDIYMGIPPGTQPEDHPELFAERISLYGAPEAPEPPPPRPFDFVLDVSQLHRRLATQPGDGRFCVTIVPVYPWSDPVSFADLSLNFG